MKRSPPVGVGYLDSIFELHQIYAVLARERQESVIEHRPIDVGELGVKVAQQDARVEGAARQFEERGADSRAQPLGVGPMRRRRLMIVRDVLARFFQSLSRFPTVRQLGEGYVPRLCESGQALQQIAKDENAGV